MPQKGERVGPYQIKEVYSFHDGQLGCYRFIKSLEIPNPRPRNGTIPIPCPNCGYGGAIILGISYLYPFHLYCPACEWVMKWTGAICPDCLRKNIGKSRYNPNTEGFDLVPEGNVTCGCCREIYDQDFIEEFTDDNLDVEDV